MDNPLIYMAWWTHLLFFGRNPGDHTPPQEEERFSFSYFRRVLKDYFRQNLIDLLYLVLSIFTYVYLALSILTFFFEKSVPNFLPHAIEILSEPYLGVLGVYVVVKEIERRRGYLKHRTWGELFAIIWFFFFVTASFLTFFSPEYHANAVYKTVVTNALAAIIIRIGMVIR